VKKSTWLQLFFLGIFLLIIGLTFNGNLNFGNGLGDLVYVYVAGGMSIINFILLLTLRKSLSKNKLLLIVFIGLNCAVLLYLTYSFTLGRGIEQPWDGTIFF